MKVNLNKPRGEFLSILSVVILIVLMDLLLGGINAWLYHHSKYGIFHRQQYILNESQDDMIIMGSSRASHHYVSSIFTDSLKMSCYNAGSEGMCIYYHYAMLAAMIERGHCPKLVVYDVMNLDAAEYPGPTFTLEAALDRLAPHYGDFECIDSLFMLKGWKEKLKMTSLTYRYNSKLVQSIKCNFIPSPEDNGYEVVKGTLADTITFKRKDYDDTPLDTLKLRYVQKLISSAHNNQIKIVFVLSPNYASEPSKALDAIKNLAAQNNIKFLDYYNEPSLMRREYFRDVMHLNDDGAHVWSEFLAHKLKEEIFR